MIDELAELLPNFPGHPNQTRCFTHVLNLVVKSILSQFDLPKAQGDRALDDGAEEILRLSRDLEAEILAVAATATADGDDDDDEDDDNVDGWVDEREEMTEEQLDELEACVQPIRLLLIKVGLTM
jgi:hypothetical protein